MPGFADIKRQARRDIHAAFAVSALYRDDQMAQAVPVTVRWHDREMRVTGSIGGDYAEVIEGVDKLLFDSQELEDLGLSLRRGGQITLTDYNDFVFILDVREPSDGPIKVTWTVTRPTQVMGP